MLADVNDNTKPDLAPDEVYCTSCGTAIKENAEVCPDCGVRQGSSQETQAPEPREMTDRRQYELEKAASSGKIGTGLLLGFFFPPVAYWLIGKRALAVVNVLTLNFLLLGFIIVPLHVWKIISDAEDELRAAGVSGY